MKITFATADLERWANDDRKREKELGTLRSKKLKARLDVLKNANNLEAIRNTPGKWHELIGNLKGHWACDLDQPYRLIIKPIPFPPERNEDGKIEWIQIVSVELVSITNYH